jgi:predicted nucleotidyltransferase component of viral defense system
MITERELRRIAGKFHLGVGPAEHEYAMLCVLDVLGRVSPLSKTLCLKGGTALRLIYFDDWRHSVDLDFSVLPAFPADELRTHIERWFAQVEVAHGITVRLMDFHRVNGAARMRAQFVGPLRHPAPLLFDVTLDEPVLLPPQRRKAVVKFFPDLRPVVLTYALEELLAEKMRSILQRGKSRDYYDVWRLLKEKSESFDGSRVRSILVRKCQHKDLEAPNAQAFLVPQYLEEAQAYWLRDLSQQVNPHALPDWTAVTLELADLLERFFEE